MKKKNPYKGVWFFGFSGVGKTYLSVKVSKKIKKKNVIIDGDFVRSHVSPDLNYSKKDRKIQIRRIMGIARIVLQSKIFVIISSVFFDKYINYTCKKYNILPIKITNIKMDKIFKTNKIYKLKNVVGKDIRYDKFSTKEIMNNYKESTVTDIIKLLKN